ncbi:MAG TPA: cation:proton antiporter [Streptosporangiaceae bacterium]|nr:cation:proton antiporter [Streptosporangiaceae bacterium]
MDVVIADVIGDIALVLLVSWLIGALARMCGQPAVIGQILAGIALGPSLLGQLPGHLTNRIFPSAALPSLTVLANVAVVIFMFVVGYELDFRQVRGQRLAAPFVAAGGLLLPLGLGIAAVAAFRSRFNALGSPHSSHAFVLYMGVVLSITALPVLAAIIRERGIAGTRAAVTATAAAGLMDVGAWLLLAVAVASTVHKEDRPPWLTVLLLCAFATAMLVGVRPGLRWWMKRRSVLSSTVPIALCLALGSAWVTASLGLHPVFGGFLAGLTMPRLDGNPDDEVLHPLEQIGGILLPLFFVVTGLSVNIGKLGADAFVVLVIVVAVACAGKLGSAYPASRLGGLPPRESAGVAVLINTRGLTELIALNVGLADGIIGKQLFAVLVLMAVITTVATAPLLTRVRLPSPCTVPESSVSL